MRVVVTAQLKKKKSSNCNKARRRQQTIIETAAADYQSHYTGGEITFKVLLPVVNKEYSVNGKKIKDEKNTNTKMLLKSKNDKI